ncbi:BA14K family protein [Mesorhizobium sp. ASY16-5R]|uniref:BA14K family protein n=1 Tax=Mesorhizobium sp. ASY16-5R TaxID=3445772 RepID=UPI003F9F8ECA
MKKLLSGVCAASLALAISVSGMAPSYASPFTPTQPTGSPSDVIKVQSNNDVIKLRQRAGKDGNRRDHREVSRTHRRDANDNRRDRREVRRDDNDRGGYYRGHRGYRDYRPGYKRHGDYWYPAAAFVAGALITGAIANSQQRVIERNVGGSHEEWCANRYRSYRAYDDTFQPNNGPRRECISPFS